MKDIQYACTLLLMYTIYICDDDKTVVSQIESCVIHYAEKKAVKIETQVFWSCENLEKQLDAGIVPDLIFLDIEFPKMNGVELGKYIRETMQNESTAIVYISSLQSYAMQLFQIRPLDFLVKPVSPIQIENELDKSFEIAGRQNRLFMYHKGHDNRRVRIADILYFESKGKEVRIVTVQGDDLFYGSTATIAPSLETARFFFSHKSFLVNYAQVSVFTYDKLIMSNSDAVPISQPKRKAVRELQNRFEAEDMNCTEFFK